MNSRRYPRTLQEAFGPYTSTHISEPYDSADRIVIWGCAVVTVALVVLTLLGVIR